MYASNVKIFYYISHGNGGMEWRAKKKWFLFLSQIIICFILTFIFHICDIEFILQFTWITWKKWEIPKLRVIFHALLSTFPNVKLFFIFALLNHTIQDHKKESMMKRKKKFVSPPNLEAYTKCRHSQWIKRKKIGFMQYACILCIS